MVEFTNGKVSQSAQSWLTNKNEQPLYDAAEPLLYFLDKYATIMVGGARAMGKYYRANKSKTLLDKLTGMMCGRRRSSRQGHVTLKRRRRHFSMLP